MESDNNRKRKSYTSYEKLEIIRAVEVRRLATNESLSMICEAFGIQTGQFSRWRQKETALLESHRNTRCVGSGRLSIFQHEKIEQKLYDWVLSMRESGMAVSYRMITVKASVLSNKYRRKPYKAQYQAARLFAKKFRFSLRAGTHQAQRAPAEMDEEALAFIGIMRPRLAGSHRDQRFIINMDQTPVFFSMTPRTTLDMEGKRTIHVRASSGSTMRVTVAVTVTASGILLPAMMIFRGKPNGRITREFKDYPKGSFYACQDKAWMDERCMLEWVDQVLAPYVKTAPIGVHPILLLDQYKCHLQESVVGRINALGVAVKHIPGGCTGLCQPIDVGIGKPLKNRMRNLWEDWMIEDGIGEDITKPVPRSVFASWVVDSLTSISSTIVRNAWRHGKYSYFPEETVKPCIPLEAVDEELVVEANDSLENNEVVFDDDEDDDDDDDDNDDKEDAGSFNVQQV